MSFMSLSPFLVFASFSPRLGNIFWGIYVFLVEKYLIARMTIFRVLRFLSFLMVPLHCFSNPLFSSRYHCIAPLLYPRTLYRIFNGFLFITSHSRLCCPSLFSLPPLGYSRVHHTWWIFSVRVVNNFG